MKVLKGTITFCMKKYGGYLFRIGPRTHLKVSKELLHSLPNNVELENIPALFSGRTIQCKAKQEGSFWYAIDSPEIGPPQKMHLSQAIEFFLKKTMKNKILKNFHNVKRFRNQVLNNPWILYLEDKIDFFTMLAIAFNTGLYLDKQALLQVAVKYFSGILYERQFHLKSDNTAVKIFTKMIKGFLSNLGINAEDTEIMDSCIKSPYVHIDGSVVYPIEVYRAKSFCLEFIRKNNPKPPMVYETIDEAMNNARVLAITGKPGTGKTTLAREVAQKLSATGRLAHLTATTGKAAKRLGENAETVHHWLGFNGRSFNPCNVA
ncbi:MAG: AAA family ATPase, partial [Dictyoglomus turgidum]